MGDDREGKSDDKDNEEVDGDEDESIYSILINITNSFVNI